MVHSKQPPSLNEDDIALWLKAHPDFLQRRPDILDHQHPPKAVSGKGIADFQAYMVKRLKADRDDVLESAREVIETSRTNMNNQTRIHKCVVMLLDAGTFEDFIHTITMDMATMLDVDIVSMVVETAGKTAPPVTLPGVRLVGPGSVEAAMEDRQVRLESDIAGLEDIYGGGAPLVKSQALLRLDLASGGPVPANPFVKPFAMPAALIAFGSRDPAFFAPGQGTELIAFLGDVTARIMRLWLDCESA